MAIRPLIYVLIVTILGGVLVSLAEGEFKSETALLLGTMSVCLIVVYTVLSIFPLGDHYIFLITAMLGVIGVIMLLRLQTGYGQKQVIWFSVGSGLFLLTALLYKNLDIWNKMSALYVFTALAFFVATAVLGSVSHGAKSWLKFGSLTFQPSELIKLLFILTLSSIYTNPMKVPRAG